MAARKEIAARSSVKSGDCGEVFGPRTSVNPVCSNDVNVTTVTTSTTNATPLAAYLSQTLLAGSGVEIALRLSGLTIFLLLADLRSGLGDAAFYEISLNLELLLRAYVHHGVERQVAR